MTHFPCHHCKTFALFAGTRRFHRRIQGQNIGLKRNIVNQRSNGANALGTVGDIVHCLDHRGHRLPTLHCRITGSDRKFIGSRRRGRVLFHRRRHLVHGRHRLLNVINCLLGMFVQFIGAFRQRLTAISDTGHLA